MFRFIKNHNIAIASFFLVLLVTVFFSFQIKYWAEQRTSNHFNTEISNIETRIERRMNFYSLLLKSGNGFFEKCSDISPQTWKKYVQKLDIEKEVPGIQGMGFAEYVPGSKFEKHITEKKSNGIENYTIHPVGKREQYTPIVFLEPLNWRNKRAIGFDMFSEPVRKEAMIRARDSNSPTLSGKVILVQETDQDVQPGFLIYTPLYFEGADISNTASRRANLKGYIYSPFRAKDFIEGIFRNQIPEIDFEIFDGNNLTKEGLIYNSDSTINFFKPNRLKHTKQSKIEIGGHQWTIFFSARPGFEIASDRDLRLTVLISGIIMAFLVFFILYFISRKNMQEQISNEKLATQNKELLKINNDLDSFIYTASHDLKAPINNIEGLVSSMQEIVSNETRQNEEFTIIMNMINKSIQRFKVTIQDLTEISKVQRNITDERSEIDVCALIEDLKQEITGQLKTNSPTINVNIADCPTIHYSKSHLRSIVYNLLSNALKFSHPDRPPVIDIQTKMSGDFVVLTIKDNGLGIEPTKINQIFGMFKRLHSHVEGTGIGLYILKRIVENNGGRIEVESELDKGTTFKIYLKSEA